MKTFLNEIKQIDDHLLKTAQPQDALLFEAMLIINPNLKSKVAWQEQTLNMVRHYGRKTLRTEIEAVHQQLFSRPEHQSFRQIITSLFFKH